MPMPSRLTRGLAAACLLLGAAVPATAQSSFEAFGDEYLEFATEVPLPRAMRPGWVPVRVTVRNQLDRPFSTDLIFSTGGGWNLQSECALSLQLDALEERDLEVLVPYFGHRFGEGVRLQARHQGRSTSSTIHQVESTSANTSSAPMLVVTSPGYALARTMQGLSVTLTRPSGQTGGTPLQTVSTGILADDLSTDWRAYSTLMVVAVDLDAPLPGRAAMDALLQWTELGGSLVFLGSRPERADELLASAGVRRQDRLNLEDRGGATIHRHGFGRIAVFPGNDAKGALQHFSLLREVPGGVFPNTFLQSPPPLPGVGLPPLSLLTAVLILIALVMGPIQFAQMKKRKAKPWRFLQVTPILGFGFAFIILAVSLLSQGLNVRESVQSVTWLDQERRTAATIASRTSFSGSLFAQTQRYGAEALTVPAPQSSSTSVMNEAKFLVDLGEGGRLRGAFLPTRVPTSSALVAHSPARSGLRLEREGETVYVVNDLDVALHKLRLVDDRGDSYQTGDPDAKIAAGDRVALTRTDALFDVRLREVSGYDPIEVVSGLELVEDDNLGIDSRRLRHMPPVLPRRSWMAEVERSPFLPDGGIRRKEEEGVHLILGLLEETP